MEGFLSKKSIHIKDSFLHANYTGIIVNFVNLIFTCEFKLLLHAYMDVTTAYCYELSILQIA